MTKTTVGLPARVAQSLLERIISQELPPGSALPTERELQEQYNVSRTVVREAVKSLEARGLITNNGTQGAVVNTNLIEPSVQALLLAFHRTHVTTGDLLLTRILIEPHIAATAATSATEVQIRRIHALERSMEALLSTPGANSPTKTHTTWANVDARFHVALAEASQNPLLMILIEILVGIAWQSFDKNNDPITVEQIQVATEQHLAITRAITERNPERARQAMIDHLESTRAHIMSQPEGLQRLIEMQIK